MPISATTIQIGLTLVRVTLNGGKKLDEIFAQKQAAQAPLSWPQSPAIATTTVADLQVALDDFLERSPHLPDEAREEIERAIVQGNPDILWPLVQRHAPHAIAPGTAEGEGAAEAYLKALHEAQLIDDVAEARSLAKLLAPGGVNQAPSTAVQVGTVVLMGLSDFALSTQETLVKDAATRKLMASILERFATPELLEAETGRRVLSLALSATLNGIVDVTDELKEETDNPWLNGLLNALVDVRDAQPETARDEFFVGLLRTGKGYPALVAEVLEEGASHLSEEEETGYRKALADFLTSATEITRNRNADRAFFETHWPDFLRAGFKAAHTNAPALLAEEDPLLFHVLSAAFETLKDAPGRSFLTSDMLEAIAEAAILSVAAEPELLADDWAQVFVGAFASVVRDIGLTTALSEAALERILRETLTRVATSPTLLKTGSEATTDLVKRTLLQLAGLTRPTAETVAEIAIIAVLDTLSAHPALLTRSGGTQTEAYALAVERLSKGVADLIRDKGLSAVDGGQILALGVRTIANNPKLFAKTDHRLAANIVIQVMEAVRNDPNQVITTAGMHILLEAVLTQVALRGMTLLKESGSSEDMVEFLVTVLKDGLTVVDAELGNSVDLASAPYVLGRLISEWLLGNLSTIDPENDDFIAAFRAQALQVQRGA